MLHFFVTPFWIVCVHIFACSFNCSYNICTEKKIECSSCKQWFSYCCAGVSAGDEVVVSVTTPFYCSRCSSTGRQPSSSQTTIRCHHCHSQTDSGRKLTTQCSKCNRSFHLSCIKMSKYQADSLPGWFCNTSPVTP